MFDLGLQLNRPKYDSELLGRWMLAAGMPTLFLVRVSKKKWNSLEFFHIRSTVMKKRGYLSHDG